MGRVLGRHQRVTSISRGPVVVDTNVFGARLREKTQDLADRYEPVLVGRGLVISFQTVMELEYGVTVAGWGATRQRRLARLINDARVVWAGRDLTRRCALLRTECSRVGHALAQRGHNADLWIAATAIWLDLPLVAEDGIFEGVPGLMRERADR